MSNTTRTPKDVYIYALCEQKHSGLIVRYIGRTRNPKARRDEHVRDSSHGQSRKAIWIRELLQKGKTPLVVTLDRVASADENDRERHWFNHFSALGCDLLNGLVPPVTPR